MLNINELIKSALKNKDSSALTVYREIKAEILKFKSAPHAKEYTDTEEFALLKRLRKQHLESLECSASAGREDLVGIENVYVNIYTSLFPQPAAPSEINQALDAKGWQTIPKNEMGAAINYLKSLFPANEGKEIATIVKYRINE